MAWSTHSVRDIALTYGIPEDEVALRVYTIAEQVHVHYCLQRGIVNHSESRPDQDVALSILGALAGSDWWLVKGVERVTRPLAGEPLAQVATDDSP